MNILRRTALGLIAGATAAALTIGASLAQSMPAPLDNPGEVKIALVRVLK